MKKLYTFLTVLAFAGTLAAQQTDDGRTHNSTSANTVQRGENPSLASFACDSVQTTLAAGNGNDGIMFDVTAVQNVRITYLDMKIQPSLGGKILVYYKSGTHVGSETNAAAWTFLDTVNVTGISGYTHIPVYIDQTVSAGNSIAFYVTSNLTQSVDYTNGTGTGNIVRQDGFIQVREGTGMSYPFSGVFANRIPNVTVNYCDATSIPSCTSDTTTFVSNNGNDGNMFDVTIGASDVTIRRMYCNVNGAGWWKIYFRPITYVGNETNPGAWILIDSAFVTSAGPDVPTLIPVDIDLYAPAGSSYAFYTTGTATGADINYTDGTTEGAVFSTNGQISILEGKGMSYPFSGQFTPRVWNGILEYCVGPTGTTEIIRSSGNWSVTVMPNPTAGNAQLMINSPKAVENASVRIFDMNGREAANMSGINSNLVQLPVEQLSSGVYFCQVLDANGAILCTSKFIRE